MGKTVLVTGGVRIESLVYGPVLTDVTSQPVVFLENK